MNQLKGKVAIVTGSARGIGRAIALGFAREGASVAVVDRLSGPAAEQEDEGSIERTAREVQELGGEAHPLRCDVSSNEEVERMAKAVIDRWGRIDILVNNAAILSRKTLLEVTPEEWTAIISVNVNGAFYCCRAIAPLMAEQASGSIINILTGQAEGAEAGLGVYRTSKAALNQLTWKLAAELQSRGVAVNGLAPGLTRTPGGDRESTRAGVDLTGVPLAEEKKIAEAAVYMAVHASDPETFFTGTFRREADFGVSWP